MYKLIARTTLLSLIACLAGCWGSKKTIINDPEQIIIEQRISGPLADTDVAWVEDDFK
jgi:hypothetical protein